MPETSSFGIGSCIFTTKAKLVIGEYVISGPNLTVITGDHYYVPQRWLKTITDEEKPNECDKDVIIDDDVWIGANVTILKGVHIGRSSIIAAGSVVTRDVLEFAIVGGIPAKVIKYKWTDEERKKYCQFTDENQSHE